MEETAATTRERRGEEGETGRCSRRSRGAAQRARGRPGDGESSAADGGARGGRRWRWRRSRASRGVWLDGEVARDVAELLGMPGRRGGGGGYGNGGRWRRQRSAVRERERGGRENGHGRERERCGAARGVVRAIQATRGEAGGGAHARGRRARAPVLLARGRGRLARPAGWAGLLGRWARPGKFLPFSSLFLFSNFLTFV